MLDTYEDADEHLVEAAFSTDDIELEFALVVLRCGYKPTMKALLGALANIDRLAALRRDADSGFSIAASTKSNATHHQASARRTAEWNDGRMLGKSRSRRQLQPEVCASVLLEHILKVQVRALRKTLPKDDPIRSHHNPVKA